MNYQQLTRDERYQISAYLKCKKTNPEIAIELKRHRSTIWREKSRNSGRRGYRPKQAQLKSELRRQDRVYFEKLTIEHEALIREKLLLQWSPEQICGRLCLEGYESLCPETIYRFIKRDKKDGGQLWINLRWSSRRRRKRFGSINRQGHLKNRVSIEDRPEIIGKRERLGDYERDTVIGKNHKGSLLTIVDRVSKKVFIGKLSKKGSKQAHHKTVHLLTKNKVHPICSITNDNGKEFADHERTSKALGAPIYFTHPYTSQERGTNENTNGLIRQYFPKLTDLRTVSIYKIKKVVNLLDLRPRKSLGFRTPLEVDLKLKSNYQLVALAV
jgi:IS30 family transposase